MLAGRLSSKSETFRERRRSGVAEGDWLNIIISEGSVRTVRSRALGREG